MKHHREEPDNAMKALFLFMTLLPFFIRFLSIFSPYALANIIAYKMEKRKHILAILPICVTAKKEAAI